MTPDIETIESFIEGEWMAIRRDNQRIIGTGPTEAAALADLEERTVRADARDARAAAAIASGSWL